MSSPSFPCVEWPSDGKVDAAWACSLGEAMRAASECSGGSVANLREAVPADVAEALLTSCAALIARDGTVVDVDVNGLDEVVVVGDTHGQFHDALRLLELSGRPGVSRVVKGDALRSDEGQERNEEGTGAAAEYGGVGGGGSPAEAGGDAEDEDEDEDVDVDEDEDEDEEVTINRRPRAKGGAERAPAMAPATGGEDARQQQEAEALPSPKDAQGDSETQREESARSQCRTIVFNGDFVDRGAWSTELLLLLCAYKIACPRHTVLLRGNHESKFCTMCYGFNTELAAKYGSSAKSLYRRCLRLFANLPLAALINESTLVLHGGLFRSPPTKKARTGKKGGRKKRRFAVELGTVDELRRANRGGQDPDGEGVRALASDVLWSDPTMEHGVEENHNRGIGLMYGPDATRAFLEANGLRLVLRSHEGPDARADRIEEGMLPMMEGFTVDHDCGEAGKLCTVFSAPSYPQFLSRGEERVHNQGAFVRLRPDTDYVEPAPVVFDAAPRPDADCFYDLDSDAETEAPDGDDEGEASDGADL